MFGGALSAVQLFERLAVVESHTLWYFGHHCCLVVGFDALGTWHFWFFTLFYPVLPFLHTFFARFHHIHSFSRLISPHHGAPEKAGGCSQSAQLWAFNLLVLLRKPGQLWNKETVVFC